LDGLRTVAVTACAPVRDAPASAVVDTFIASRHQHGLLRSAVVASGATIAVLAVVLAVLVVTLGAQRDANRRVRRAEQVLRVSLAAERSVVDTETALRGYLITLDRSFLGPYRTGAPGALRSTQRLIDLTAGDPAQQAAARRIRGQVSAYVNGYARQLVALAAAAPQEARTPARTADGRRRVDAIRAGFDALTATERARLDARTRSADAGATRAVVVGVGGLLVLLVLVGAFGWYVARRIARPVRDISIAAGQVAAGDLAVRVPEGGAGELDSLARAFNAMAASLAQAQDALRRRADELEASGRRTAALLEPVFEQAPAGLAVFDEQMRFVRVNAALAEMDGVAPAEHLGHTIGDVLPGMAGELGARLRDVIAERRTITDAELEGTTRTRPGEPRVWRASYFPVLADDGPAIGSGAIFVDITEHRRAARERRRLLVAERLAAAHTARLHEITSRLSRAVGAGDVAQVVVDQGVAALRAQAGVVVLLHPRASELRLAAQDGYDEREALDWRDLPLADPTPLAEAVREGRVVAVVGRPELRERYPARARVLERPGHRSWIAAPIRVGGDVRGGALFAFGVSRRLPDDDMRLLELLLAQAGPALDRAALYERQRHIASTLQRGLLPAHLPEIPGIDIAAVYRPAGDGNEVGGDFYDVVPTSGGRFVVAIGDVQGKGPEAAALTGLVRHTLRAETLHEGDPAHLLRMLNRVVHRDDTDRFCTVALAAIEPGARGVRVRVACGGHLPPIVTRRDEAPAEVACRGTLLGVEEEIDVVCEDLELGLGDGLVLYTDGVLDAAAPSTTLTAAHLVALLADAPDASPHDLAWRLHDAAVGDADTPRDDIAIVALRVTSGDPLTAAAAPAARAR
jgi:PAS domain S-box-containing protein